MSDPTTPSPEEQPVAVPAYSEPVVAPVAQQPLPPAQPQVAVAADFPGKTLGIVGLVLAILIPIVGVILSHVAASQTKHYGRQIGQAVANTPAKVGIILGWVFVGLWLLFVVLWVVIFVIALAAGTVTTTSN